MTEEKRQEIIKAVSEYLSIGTDENQYEDMANVEYVINEIYNDSLIWFASYIRYDNQDECWTQVEYWSESLKKPIIMDYDWYSCFESEQEMIDAIIGMQEQCEQLEKKLEVLR